MRMRNFFYQSLILIAAGIPVLKSYATIINVPMDVSTIQSGINAAGNGDTVVVSLGTYFENINFKGKNIVVTSNFYLAGDTSFISQTTINGSAAINADTGSCVIISSGEDSTAVLMGFTITGGTGTKWLDAHGAGTYREGGGVLIDFSSPTIRNNKIIYNTATNSSGVSGAGGGGIRISDGNPYILNNLISLNQGKYGPGIVLNYTGCIIRNNIISYNSGGQTFNGGGAIWSNTNSSQYPKIIENNTIYKNTAAVGTGGCLVWGGTVVLRNNIIRENSSTDNSQVKVIGGSAQVTFCNVEGGYTGAGNIDADPQFIDTLSFLLNLSSSSIDAGDSSAVYNDIEDFAGGGNAKFPSMGTTRNDMGAYGGQGAAIIPAANMITGISMDLNSSYSMDVFPNPAHDTFTLSYNMTVSGFIEINLMEANGRMSLTKFRGNQSPGSYLVNFENHLAPGLYILELKIDGVSNFKIVAIQ